jgi:hypothetical protein
LRLEIAHHCIDGLLTQPHLGESAQAAADGLVAMRRNTEARLPEISREGSISSNGSASRRGSTMTPQSVESVCRSAPSCSALLSFSARKIKPFCLARFHSSSRKSAIIPDGAADEIKARASASFILAEEGRRTPFAFGRPFSLIIPSCCLLQKLSEHFCTTTFQDAERSFVPSRHLRSPQEGPA